MAHETGCYPRKKALLLVLTSNQGTTTITPNTPVYHSYDYLEASPRSGDRQQFTPGPRNITQRCGASLCENGLSLPRFVPPANESPVLGSGFDRGTWFVV